MAWLAFITNGIIAMAYLSIGWLIAERLVHARQGLRSNPLAVATSAIFFSCGIGHGLHTLHALHSVRTGAPSDLLGTPMVAWDASTAAVAIWYWTLRRFFGALVAEGSLFEDRAAATARRLAATLEIVQDGLMLYDVTADAAGLPAALVLRSVNEAARRLLDLPLAVAPGERFTTTFSSDFSRTVLPNLLEVAARDGSLYRETGWITLTNGGRVTGELRADAHDGGLLLCWRDTTERTRGIEEARRLQADLATTFSAAPTGMAVISLEGVVERVNPALAEMLFCTPEALVGRAESSFSHPDDQPGLQAQRVQLFKRGGVADQEHRLVAPDGNERWVRRTAALVLDEGRPRHFLAQYQDISQRKRYEAQLRHMADHDPLTGLLNRRGFDAALRSHAELVRRYGPRGALLMIDLDHFKDVNDTLGHPAGDQLIVSVADLLRQTTRDSDLVGRLGGDEFAVLMPVGGQEAACQLAERITSVIRGRTSLLNGEHPGTITASIGIKVLVEGDIDPQALLVDGDLSLYDAKQAGRDRWSLYRTNSHGQPRAKSQLMWLERVRTALEGDGFLLAAQPILDAAEQKITHHELLLRLPGPDGVPVLPAHFLYIIEQHGLMQDVDRWVISSAISLLAADAYGVLCVNISARSLTDSAVIEHLTSRLRDSGVSPNRLVVEITETAAVANITAARQFITGLRALGVQVALDDFGAGFGSFYYLKHLPFDYLKIDGEFVNACLTSDIDRLVIGSVMALARGLGKQVVAEFVADAATQRYLTEQGVDYLQGYHIGRPALIDIPVALAAPTLRAARRGSSTPTQRTGDIPSPRGPRQSPSHDRTQVQPDPASS